MARLVASDPEFRFEVQRWFPVSHLAFEQTYGPNWDAIRMFCRRVGRLTDDHAEQMVNSAFSTQEKCSHCSADNIRCEHTSGAAALGREAATQAAGRQQQVDAARTAVRNVMRNGWQFEQTGHGPPVDGVCQSVVAAISTSDLVAEEGPFLPAHLDTLVGPAVTVGLLPLTFGSQTV